MKQINAITQERVSFLLFPDNQPRVQIKDVNEGEEVEVVIRLASSLDVMNLLQISDALEYLGAHKSKLTISYLMAARYDRHMVPGDAHALRVVAKLINDCKFWKVEIFDPHSDTALALIERSHAITNEPLVRAYDRDNAILICPDAVFEGAQGLLLDENNKEFFPHVTHSSTGMRNVEELCSHAGIDRKEIYYVSRTYLTRHGAGPLPGEDNRMSFEDETNKPGAYQGALRFAPLDPSGLYSRCKEDAGSNPWKIVLTHCDQLAAPCEADLYSDGKTRNCVGTSVPKVVNV